MFLNGTKLLIFLRTLHFFLKILINKMSNIWAHFYKGLNNIYFIEKTYYKYDPTFTEPYYDIFQYSLYINQDLSSS